MYNSIINPNGRCGKIKKLILFIILTVAVSLPCYAKEPQVRGVWVSTVYNLDYPSEAGISPAQMMHEADEIITSAARAGINTIFLQVRPCCDAIYPSEIFPFSQYISGVQGQQPEGGFDPLDYFIDRCHEMGIELHAWVNPYRVTVSRFTSIEEGLATLSPAHPARLHPQWVRLGKDGRLYFDPALPEVLELITDGVREILDNYDVDGIHLDDYFYPDGGLDDSGSFELYGGGFDNIGDFRRDNVDRAVKSLHQLAEEYNTTFGISPFGIWANRMSNLSGSNTIGGQSYYDHYADTLKWIKEGWLDYVAPQLYWEIGSLEGDFEALLRWWRSATEGSGVDLYIGLGAYRADDADISSGWYKSKEILRQLDMIDLYGQTEGVVYFRYRSVTNSSELYEYISDSYTKAVPDPSPPVFYTGGSLTVISPMMNERAVGGEYIRVECRGDSGSALYAMGNGSFEALAIRGLQYSAPIKTDNDYAITVLNERSGLVSLRITAIELLDNKNSCSLYDIDCQEVGEYTAVTFHTDSPATARCSADGRYITLDISPCRSAVLFECEKIKYMVTEKKAYGIRYIFALTGPASEYYIDTYDDRIILFIR